ncbi:oligopeptide ABC transporter substrate-binding protein [Oceanicola granulosus HTCC2516]|uniref:Oligopeptide ABC transporter substrate-binding protein n=1 Tax=Oceanicola granulosus (strain ATCC BAA-861 / DSM 15982 / KCTC 12143 / HTCC2516) TaxID=314256 RepID=Q2CEF6_OCEGH|nr:ABC transporter substrate-binding protein [Oceanicola granulosus]EAR51041.1 oligopeptide ABC transporter substrate-binding protein [Oceanicola granulosus HTCC2516]
MNRLIARPVHAQCTRRAALALSGALVALSMSGTGVAAQDETTLRIARPDDVRALNPFRQANNSTSEVTYQIHEGLVTVTPEQEIVPVLATEWELLDDGLTYRVKLREGVTFHSGAPFNAEAVAWNMDKQLNGTPPGIAAGLIPPLSAIEVVDEYTIDFTLEEPSGVFMAILAAPLFMIVDPTAYAELGDDNYDSGPSGTGPFMFESWSPGENVTLVDNEAYWDEANGPEVDKVVFEVIPEASARSIALQNGEIDVAFTVAAEQMELFRDGPYNVHEVPSTRVVFIGLNTADPILSDVKVRQALGHAMDREMIDAFIGPNGSLASGMGVDGALGFFPSAREFDPDAARSLLDEAGWSAGSDGVRTKDGEPLEIDVWTQASYPGEIEALQVVQQQWRDVGAQMNLVRLEGGALYSGLSEQATAHHEDSAMVPEYQGFVLGSGIRTGEVGYITERPKCDQGPRGYGRYCNPEYDEAFNLSQSPASVEERLVGYERMAEIFHDDAIRLPLFVLQINVVTSDKVEGLVLNPSQSLNLRGVSIAD